MLPVIVADEFNVTTPFASIGPLIKTLPVPAGFKSMLPLVFVDAIVLLDTVMFVPTGPAAYTSSKLSFNLSKAVRNGSPVLSLADTPMLTVCFAMI